MKILSHYGLVRIYIYICDVYVVWREREMRHRYFGFEEQERESKCIVWRGVCGKGSLFFHFLTYYVLFSPVILPLIENAVLSPTLYSSLYLSYSCSLFFSLWSYLLYRRENSDMDCTVWLYVPKETTFSSDKITIQTVLFKW